MQKEQLVAVAIRVFAIFIVIYTIRYGASLLPILESKDPPSASWVFFGFFVIPPLLATAILWLFPLTVARGLLPKVSTSGPNDTLGIDQFQIVALSILGIWVLCAALPDVFYWIIFVYLMNRSEMGELTPDHIGNILATGMELAIGFWLVLGLGASAALSSWLELRARRHRVVAVGGRPRFSASWGAVRTDP